MARDRAKVPPEKSGIAEWPARTVIDMGQIA